MCGVLSMEGLVPIFGASECSSQFQRRSKGPEEVSFILSRATEGNRVPPEIQMVYPCEATASAPTKGQIPQFHLSFFSLFPFLTVATAEIRNTASCMCHYLYYEQHR